MVCTLQNQKCYLVLAYYLFTPIDNPQQEVLLHKDFLKSLDATCRIYISENGINGQLSAEKEDALKYMEWMHARPEFAKMVFKQQLHHENAFPRVTVKYRKQLVALDETYNLAKAGEHLSPSRWKQMLEQNDNKLLLDIRNDYEWKVGHFKGSECPPCETFRDFRNYAETLLQRVDPKNTPVMMCCTGGIRCELFSAVLKEKGFEKVYQLDGGIINYGLKEGSKHWLGKLFVFDDRLTVPVSHEPSPIIGECHHCKQPNDTYYNCANMDCNALFLCCKECLEKYLGCCKDACKSAERIRPYQHCTHKPFRKWYHYSNEKIKKGD